jgi:hypothetical protein
MCLGTVVRDFRHAGARHHPSATSVVLATARIHFDGNALKMDSGSLALPRVQNDELLEARLAVILAHARIHFDVNAENGFWITCATARPE